MIIFWIFTYFEKNAEKSINLYKYFYNYHLWLIIFCNFL